ncbi:MAG TPA: lysylphosphatidylglycerol synthase domain-containing protein [Kofleriaceae bacterium]
MFNIAVMVVGGGILAWMMHDIGWAKLVEVARGVGSAFAIILGLDVIALLIDARALHTFLGPASARVSYWRVLVAQASGRAINVVTPLGALGEPTKLSMLVAYAPRGRVVSALVLMNLSTLYISVLVMIIGTPITLLSVDLPRALKITVGIGMGVLIPLVIVLGVLVQRGALSTLIGLLRRVRLISSDRRDRWRKQLVEVDRHIAELYKKRSTGTWHGILWVLLSRLITWFATILLIHELGVVVSPLLVVGVLSVGVLIQWVASIVPLGLGLADGGNYALFDLLGAPGMHGAFVTMLNRARSLLVALVGFAIMLIFSTGDRLVRPKR